MKKIESTAKTKENVDQPIRKMEPINGRGEGVLQTTIFGDSCDKSTVAKDEYQ